MLNRRFNTTIKYLISFVFIIQIVYLSGCIEYIEDNGKEINNEINIGTIYDVSGFYPWMMRDSASCSLNQNFFNPLVELNPKNLKIVPALAENWYNLDNVTWNFHLRKGVKFHNGNNFTAQDVKFTIDFLRNFSFYNSTLSSISEVNILDNYTIEIKTNEPNPIFLYDLLLINILSKEYIHKIDETNETWPVGTGAYKLVEYVPDEYITLERFNEYWKGIPKITRINVVIMENHEELKNALIEGEVDLAYIPFEYVEEISNTPELVVKSVSTPTVVYLSFDFRVNDSYGFEKSKNPVSDVRIRKAMYHAINIDTLIENISNISAKVPMSQFVTPYLFGHNPNIKRLPYDINKAVELMTDAGYKDGFTIEMDCSDSNFSINLCKEIAHQLAEINITVKINPLPEFEYYSKLYCKNTSFYVTGFNSLNAEGTIELLLHTSDMQENIGIWNYGNYSNPEVDRIYEIVCYTMESDTRKELIQQVFTIAMDDVAWIPLYSSKAFYGICADFEWNPRPSQYIIFEEISISR